MVKYVAVGNFLYNSAIKNVCLTDLRGEGGNALETQPHANLFRFILASPTGDWHTTAYYQIVRAKLESGVPYYGISWDQPGAEQALEDWYQSRVQLLRSVQREGCQKPITYVRVARAKKVRNQIDDGLHRCGAALALGLEYVPAICLNDELTAIAQRFYNEECKLYQPMYDKAIIGLEEWRVIRSGTARRAALIKAHLPVTPEHKLLDIGANMGYFSFLLADECAKAQVFAIDTMPYYAQWVAVLTRVLSVRGPNWYKGRVVVWQGDYAALLGRAPFDVVLNLSVFHHIFLRDETEFAMRMRQLSQVTDTMFFEMGTAEEEFVKCKLQEQHRELIFQQDIPVLIEKYTDFHVRDLGVTDYRHLFLCTHLQEEEV